MLREIRNGVAERGYYYCPEFAAPGDGHVALLRLANRLGALFQESDPIVTTRPSARAPTARPFDKPESLGWHNDFSTHVSRPELSLAFIARADPRGADYGAWRVASVERVIQHLADTTSGREVLRGLMDTPVPFSFTRAGPRAFHRVLEPRCEDSGRYRMRFYGRAIRFGLRRSAPEERAAIESCVAAVENAAEQVGETCPASAGALLVAHNWFCLHDRTAQTVCGRKRRQSLLCFVHTSNDAEPSARSASDDKRTGGVG